MARNPARSRNRKPPTRFIVGQSGIEHKVYGIGIDEERRRLILISADHDARTSAMVQSDVQSTLKEYRVLTLRPVAFDLQKVAARLSRDLGDVEVPINRLAEWVQALPKPGEVSTPPFIHTIGRAIQVLSDVPQIPFLDLIQQLQYFDFRKMFASGTHTFSLRTLLETDFTQFDRSFGICRFPLYDLGGDRIDRLASAANVDDAREFMSEIGVLQYFFAPADTTSLGLIDRGVNSREVLGQHLEGLPLLGHLKGTNEIVTNVSSPVDYIEALCEQGYLVEGEVGFDLSEKGAHVRSQIKFRPREGLLARLMNRVNMNISLADIKDLFH